MKISKKPEKTLSDMYLKKKFFPYVSTRLVDHKIYVFWTLLEVKFRENSNKQKNRQAPHDSLTDSKGGEAAVVFNLGGGVPELNFWAIKLKLSG